MSAPDVDTTAPLSHLAVGDSAQIGGYSSSCPGEVRRRLVSLGFVPGATVSKVRRAPLGDPSVFRVMNYEMCLRNHEADYIECAVKK